MIRTTQEAAFFGLWRDPILLRRLARPRYLTTARYEPILRRQFGGGHIDLVFEDEDESCVLSGLRLDSIQLICRERSPFIWPSRVAAVLDAATLLALEAAIIAWLRSLARGRPMAAESIRRFVPSARFDRARERGLVGAGPLEDSIVAMAPFVYARRFVTGESVVRIACRNGALAVAVLSDIGATIEWDFDGGSESEFDRRWYGLSAIPRIPSGKPAILISDQQKTNENQPALSIHVDAGDAAGAAIIDIPMPVPWDLIFSFDSADAPVAACFSVFANEAPLRPCAPLIPPATVGGSAGTIVLAVAADALAMRGADIEELETLGRRLAAEGFRVHLTAQTDDPILAEAELVHIFGSSFESHTIAFADFAAIRGIDYVFDLPPKPVHSSALRENSVALIFRAALDDSELARYVWAYEQGKLDASGQPGPTQEDDALLERRFIELAVDAVALLAVEEDVEALRSALPPDAAHRVVARGVFLEPETTAAAIGHLVPSAPFALVHAAIGARSNSLYTAVAAERCGLPIVIAGPVYDVDYLQTLRGVAPSAIVLADPNASTVSALYRRAAIWVDAAPRPRSAAALLRAVSCGALPVLAADSPLARIAGPRAPTFSSQSLDACTSAIARAFTMLDRPARIAALQFELLPRRDPQAAFTAVVTAYAKATARDSLLA